MTTESTIGTVVQRSVIVPLEPDEAFELFTTRMTDYWPRHHSIGTAAVADVIVEPRLGGRWYERGVDGSECTWGEVAQWQPPGKVLLLWQITATWQYDPTLETEVEITFTPDQPGHTRVELTHHLENYGDHTEQIRAVFESPQGWGHILTQYANLT